MNQSRTCSYPKTEITKIQLENLLLQTQAMDGKTGIIVQGYPLEDPACFWIDNERVYLRINWSTWSTVSVSNPEQIVSICNRHFCWIFHLWNDTVRNIVAPVYRITALPKLLFPKNIKLFSLEDSFMKEMEQLLDDKEKVEEEEEKNSISDIQDPDYRLSFEKISAVSKEFSEKVLIYSNFRLNEYFAPAVIADDPHILLLKFLPEITNYTFKYSEKTYEPYLEDEWGEENISLKFIDQLRAMREFINEKELGAVVDIGFLANTETMENFQFFMNKDKIADLKLLTYVTMKEDLTNIFGIDDEGSTES